MTGTGEEVLLNRAWFPWVFDGDTSRILFTFSDIYVFNVLSLSSTLPEADVWDVKKKKGIVM